MPTAPHRLLLAAGLALAPAFLAAQQPAPAAPAATPPAGRLSSLVGFVVDSVNGGPLVGATIYVDGTSRSAQSDSSGRFRVDSVPPGSWRLALSHSLLDTLGLNVSTQAIPFGRDSVLFVRMSTPSIPTLVAAQCPPAARRLGPAVILGRALEAETAMPMAGARASLVWEESEMVGSIQVRKVTRVRAAVSDSAGRFALCGLPRAIQGTLVVERAGAKTPEIPAVLDGLDHALFTVLLAAPAVVVAEGAPAARLRGNATLRGRVVGRDSRGVANARVTVEGTGAGATTDSTGRFTIGELPAGTWTVLARRVGSSPEPRVVSLPPERVTEVAFVLRPAPTQLETVVVRDAATVGLQRVGFEARRQGGMGHYITAEQIAQQRPSRMTDLLRGVPGVQVVSDGRGRQMIRGTRDGGQGCVEIFVDGVSSMDAGEGLDTQVPPSEIAAVEVYSASAVPADFTRPGRGSCGAVAVWTKTRVGRGR